MERLHGTRPFTWAMIEAKIEKRGDGCWLWQGRGAKTGPKVRHNGRLVRLIHLVWAYQVGPLEDNEILRRVCKEQQCVNPKHRSVLLSNDAFSGVCGLNRERTHCVNGHLLAGSNVYLVKTGGRKCRACMNRRRKARQVAQQVVRADGGSRVPTSDELRAWLVEGRSYVDISKEVGLSDQSVRNWAQRYDLLSFAARKNPRK